MTAKKEATPLIYGKMLEIMRAIGAIGKGQENTFHHYKYRGIDDIYNALGPIMAQCGVFMTSVVLKHEAQATPQQHHTLQIQYTFWAEDGSNVCTDVVGEGADKGDKAVYKALAGAHKYCLLQTFVVPTADAKDAEVDSPDLTVAHPEQQGNTGNGKIKTFDPPAEDGEDGTVSGPIDKFAKKATKNGGQMWSVEVQGAWVSTFKQEDGAELEKANREHLPVGLTYAINGKYRNLTAVCLLGQPEEEQLQVDGPPPIDDNDLVPF